MTTRAELQHALDRAIDALDAYNDELEQMSPADWDGESFCTVEGCHRPACHRLLVGICPEVTQWPGNVTDDPGASAVSGAGLFEMVCCQHAEES